MSNSKPTLENGVLTCTDGTKQRLSLLELLLLRIGVVKLDSLDRKYNSEPQKGW